MEDGQKDKGVAEMCLGDGKKTLSPSSNKSQIEGCIRKKNVAALCHNVKEINEKAVAVFL